MGWDMEDAGAEIERLEARLRAAEDVCVLFGWMPSIDSERGKAAFELWKRWADISGNDGTSQSNPHLSDEYIAELAAKRDATRAEMLAKIERLMPELNKAKHSVDK